MAVLQPLRSALSRRRLYAPAPARCNEPVTARPPFATLAPEREEHHAEHQLLPRRAARGPRAARLPRARCAPRHAAAREPGDPRARPGGAALVLAQLAGGVPRRRPRAPLQGAVPGLRLADDRLPLLRLPAGSPARRAKPHPNA